MDGLRVRSTYMTDYTEGGHGYVYPWVPKNEIWIEQAIEQAEAPFIVAHEYIEHRLMRDDGMEYDKAHECCSEMEFDLRKADERKQFPGLSRQRFRKSDLSKLTRPEFFEFVQRKYEHGYLRRLRHRIAPPAASWECGSHAAQDERRGISAGADDAAGAASAAEHCRGCDLYKRATQTVFGEGPKKAALMLVGEIPGDQEDQQGHVFVGPAGRLLDESLAAVGLNRKETYITNAVKHFSWQERGKRRLHQKPKWGEVQACKPWLQAEILTIAPKLVVCLGATAAQSLLGSDFRITKHRGELLKSELADRVMATYHPSAILRAPEPADRDRMRVEFIADLRRAIKLLAA